MTDAIVTPTIPTTKKDRVLLALELLAHATKTDQRTWTKASLSREDPERLELLIRGWARRARKGKVVHLAALDGNTPACYAEKDREPTQLERLTLPLTRHANVTCQGCRTAAGMLSEEEERAFLAAELAQIAAEAPQELDEPSPARRTRKAKAKKSRGTSINPTRFSAAANDLGFVEVYGKHKGERFYAAVDAQGVVTYGDTTHATLSAAATSICGGSRNGWSWWRLLGGESVDWLRGTDAPASQEAA